MNREIMKDADLVIT